MKRTCVLHGSEFKDVLLSDCFVDKSMLAKVFLYMRQRLIRVTAPWGFGKTVNLKMLKAFLQAENGVISSSQTQGCKLFIKHNLDIFKFDKDFFTFHCGKYTVIYVTFRKTTGNSFNRFLYTFREVIRDSFLEHGYLLFSTRLNDNQKFRISLYIDKMFYKTLTEVQLQEALGYLSEMLYSHFKTLVIVLIDDFDAPVWKLLSTDFPMSDVHKTISFTQEFMFKSLENNRFVKTGLINDCMCLSEVLLRTFNNITKFYFLKDHPFVKYYGLTEDEVRVKLNYFNILHKHEDVKAYYNGYQVEFTKINVYSTWSVLNYLQTEVLTDYWIATNLTNFQNLKSMFLHKDVQTFVLQLVLSKRMTIERHRRMTIRDVTILRDLIASSRYFNWREVERFFMVLFDNGYFNSKPINYDLLALSIPNEIIYQHLYKDCLAN